MTFLLRCCLRVGACLAAVLVAIPVLALWTVASLAIDTEDT